MNQEFEFLALCIDCQEIARGDCTVCGLPHCGSVFCHEDCECSDMLNKGEENMELTDQQIDQIECYELWQHSDACIDCLWQDDCIKQKEIGIKIMEELRQIAKVSDLPEVKYPLCYCKVCQGDTKHAECPSQDNPHAPPTSLWFRALRGEPIYITEEGIR